MEMGTLIPYLAEMFRLQAWIAMGKVASPVSGKVERNLQVSQQMIDLLGELEAKTEGNRTDDETKLLQGVLTELRLNYVEEVNKPKSEDASGDKEPEFKDGAKAEDETEPAKPEKTEEVEPEDTAS